jgi:O-antigen/teichoic acid export membrane protein
MSNSRRIAKNTLMLYSRQILTMLVSFYTVRVVLNVLGAEDYGIYHVVAGVVMMFGFLSGSLASASQRYFSFELGKSNHGRLKHIFSLSLLIYILLIALIVLLAETIGLWFVTTRLVISPGRREAAMWVYHTSILSFGFSIFASPYIALIIAHEDMNIYAYMSIIEAALRLASVFLLRIVFLDKLQLYGILMCLVVCINTTIYRMICRVKYKECRFDYYWNKGMFKEITAYTGWYFFTSLALVIKQHAVTILLNQLFNPMVIAARSIAIQVNSAVSSFSNNFSTAMNPQIIKSYSSGKKPEMLALMSRGVRGNYFLMYLFTLPLVLEMPVVLSLWLKNPPEGAALFTQLTLVDVLINSIGLPLACAIRATGNIKNYALIFSALQTGGFLLGWLIFLLGAPPYSVMLITIGISVVFIAVRLLIVRTLIKISVARFFSEAIFPCCIFSIVSAIFPLILRLVLKQNILNSIVVIFACLLFTCGSMYAIGLNKVERGIIKQIILRKLTGEKVA